MFMILIGEYCVGSKYSRVVTQIMTINKISAHAASSLWRKYEIDVGLGLQNQQVFGKNTFV